jgi:hypothetical protein
MIEDRARAVDILRCAEFFSRPRQIDVFAMKFAVAIMKGVHGHSVTAVFGSARVRNVAPKARYHSSLGQRPRSSVNSNRALKARFISAREYCGRNGKRCACPTTVKLPQDLPYRCRAGVPPANALIEHERAQSMALMRRMQSRRRAIYKAANLSKILRTPIRHTPATKLVRTRVFPCLINSPRTA